MGSQRDQRCRCTISGVAIEPGSGLHALAFVYRVVAPSLARKARGEREQVLTAILHSINVIMIVFN